MTLPRYLIHNEYDLQELAEQQDRPIEPIERDFAPCQAGPVHTSSSTWMRMPAGSMRNGRSVPWGLEPSPTAAAAELAGSTYARPRTR